MGQSGAWVKIIHEKNLKSKISRHSPICLHVAIVVVDCGLLHLPALLLLLQHVTELLPATQPFTVRIKEIVSRGLLHLTTLLLLQHVTELLPATHNLLQREFKR